MNKFLKELMTLAIELNEAEGFNALTVINDMEMLYDKHVKELKKLHIADVMRSANCYNDLKAWLLVKKSGKRLCDWDDHKHQEIWDKMLELEKLHSEHYA